jgi:hypothetical protein
MLKSHTRSLTKIPNNFYMLKIVRKMLMGYDGYRYPSLIHFFQEIQSLFSEYFLKVPSKV